jgi:hypothetical protein
MVGVLLTEVSRCRMALICGHGAAAAHDSRKVTRKLRRDPPCWRAALAAHLQQVDAHSLLHAVGGLADIAAAAGELGVV